MDNRKSFGAWPFARPGCSRFPALVVSVLLLAGCQSTVSLEEAKKVTASFEGKGFVAPPRTIKDITAILDQQTIADPEESAQRVAKADEQPPAAGDAAALAKFYWARGKAANNVGREQQRLEDLRTALQYAEKTTSVAPRLWGDLAWAERSVGNYKTAIRLMRFRTNAQPKSYAAASSLTMILAQSGDMEAAEKAKQTTLQLLANTRSTSPWVGVNKANVESFVLEAQGLYAQSEPFLRQAMNIFESAGLARDRPTWLDSRRGMLARNLRWQRRYVEAEIVARDALLKVLERGGKVSGRVAGLVRDLGNILKAQGRYEDAETLIRAAIDIFEKSGTPPDSFSLMSTRFILANTLMAQEDWQGAIETMELSRQGNQTAYDQKFGDRPFMAQALLYSGRTDEALAIISPMYDRVEKRLGAKHIDTAKLGMSLAVALNAADKKEAALGHFAKSVPIITNRSRQSDDDSTSDRERTRLVQLGLEPYIGLLADIRGTALERKSGIDAVAEAFRISNIARSGSVQESLAASGARSLASNPDLSDLVRREQDTRKQTSTLYALLADMLSAPSDQQDPKAVHDLKVRIDNLRGARATLMEEIEARFPEYAELINPKAATIERARASLNTGEAMLVTYTAEEKTYVWAIPKEGEVAFTVAELGREDLGDTVALLRSSLEPNAQTLGDIPDFDVAAGYGLYEQLFKPVEAGWKNAKSLLVVAHGALGYLPPSILPTAPVELDPASGALFSNHRDVAWLARSHAVTMLPSVASLATLRSLPPGSADRKAFAGFGDPLFSAKQATVVVKKEAEVAALTSRGLKTRGLPVRLRAAPKTGALDSAELAQLPRLPDTADEVRSIAVALNADLTQDIFLGPKANESAVKSHDLSGYKVLAFATHGLVPGDLNGLMQPALALTAPGVAGVEGDGLLTMGEILGLKLDADWVVLSACNTGSGAGAGAEAVSGLGQAFFYAGTRALLVSNWPVETTSAKALTTDLFRRQAKDTKLSRAEALQRAMLALIDDGGYVDPKSKKVVFSYAHPIFWAPFTLIGDGGVGKPFS
ncbi:MAG: CHAT domain-containing protein [Rhodospirillales bacterium]|nr:CHAT domain-containing protein [Rhodospirillales bacterium]